MLNKAEILNSLGYLKSSVGYKMAEAFLNSSYVNVIEQEMLGKIRDERARFNEEVTTLEQQLQNPDLSEKERKNIAHAMTVIADKLNSLHLLQEGIKKEIGIQLKIALITSLRDPKALADVHSPLDIRHLKEVVMNFHSRKAEGSNKKEGFKKSTAQLIDAQAAFLGVERRGLLGFLKHVLGGLLTGLGVGLPLLSKSFRNVFFSTKTQQTIKASHEAVKGVKRRALETVHYPPEGASIEDIKAKIIEAEQRQIEVYSLLERLGVVNHELRTALESIDDLRIRSNRDFRRDLSSQSLQKNIEPIQEGIVALKAAIQRVDEAFSKLAGQDNPEVNAARTKLANLLRFEQFVDPLVPKKPAEPVPPPVVPRR